MAGPALLGPWNPVAGTPKLYTFGPETQWVYVRNQTRFTLLVVFQNAQPTSTDSLGNQYDNVVREGGELLMWTQARGASAAERSLNAVGAFGGSVWIMPVDLTSTQAVTGTFSSTNNVWVGAGGPYDPPPPVSAGIPLGTDLTSQPRVVCVPMGITGGLTGHLLSADTLPAVLGTYGPGAAQIAAGFAPIYLYYLYMSPDTNITGGWAFILSIQWQTSGGVSVGPSFPFLRGSIAANSSTLTTTPYVFAPPWPLVKAAVPATAAKFVLQFETGGGTRLGVNWTVGFGLDPNNTIQNSEIGTQQNWNAFAAQQGLKLPFF